MLLQAWLGGPPVLCLSRRLRFQNWTLPTAPQSDDGRLKSEEAVDCGFAGIQELVSTSNSPLDYIGTARPCAKVVEGQIEGQVEQEEEEEKEEEGTKAAEEEKILGGGGGGLRWKLDISNGIFSVQVAHNDQHRAQVPQLETRRDSV